MGKGLHSLLMNNLRYHITSRLRTEEIKVPRGTWELSHSPIVAHRKGEQLTCKLSARRVFSHQDIKPCLIIQHRPTLFIIALSPYEIQDRDSFSHLL